MANERNEVNALCEFSVSLSVFVCVCVCVCVFVRSFTKGPMESSVSSLAVFIQYRQIGVGLYQSCAKTISSRNGARQSFNKMQKTGRVRLGME